MPSSISRLLRSPAPVPWPTVAAFAVLMAYADGFWLTSVAGAVGAIERVQSPFASWLRTSTVMLPMFVVAVLIGLSLARRILGPVLRTTRTIVAAALLVAATGTVVGTAELAVSAVYDYHLQSRQLDLVDATHDTSHVHDPGQCVGLCAAKRATLLIDARAAGYGSAAVLGTNVVLVAWVLAMRGGRLDPVRRKVTAQHA
jgi:hypothetical protein